MIFCTGYTVEYVRNKVADLCRPLSKVTRQTNVAVCLHPPNNPAVAANQSAHTLMAEQTLTQEQLDEQAREHEGYVKRIEGLGSAWPTAAELATINEFASQAEAMGFTIQFQAPGDFLAKYARWGVYLKIKPDQSDWGEGKTVFLAAIDACERLLAYIKHVWDGDYLIKSDSEPIVEKLLEMARALPQKEAAYVAPAVQQ